MRGRISAPTALSRDYNVYFVGNSGIKHDSVGPACKRLGGRALVWVRSTVVGALGGTKSMWLEEFFVFYRVIFARAMSRSSGWVVSRFYV